MTMVCQSNTPTADPAPPPARSAPSPDAGAASSTANPAQAISERELAAELARAPALPGGARLGVVCCMVTSVAGNPVFAALSVLLPALPDPLAHGTPSVPLGESWTISSAGEVLSRPDFARARALAPASTQAAMGALAAAHTRLRSLPLYQVWQRKGLPYTTMLTPHAKGFSIYFTLVRGPASADVDPDSVAFELEGSVVVGAWAGVDHTPL